MDPEEEEEDEFAPEPSVAAPGTVAEAEPAPEFQPAGTQPQPASPQRAAQRDEVAEMYGFVDPARTPDPAATRAAQKALRDEYDRAQRDYSIGGYSSPQEMMAERGGLRSDWQGGWGGATMNVATNNRYSGLPREVERAPRSAATSPEGWDVAPAGHPFAGARTDLSPTGRGALGVDFGGKPLSGPAAGHSPSSGAYGMGPGERRSNSERAYGTQPGQAPAGYAEWMGAGGSGAMPDWNTHAGRTGQAAVPYSATVPQASAPRMPSYARAPQAAPRGSAAPPAPAPAPSGFQPASFVNPAPFWGVQPREEETYDLERGRQSQMGGPEAPEAAPFAPAPAAAGPADPRGGGGYDSQPVYDQYGNVIGYR